MTTTCFGLCCDRRGRGGKQKVSSAVTKIRIWLILFVILVAYSLGVVQLRLLLFGNNSIINPPHAQKLIHNNEDTAIIGSDVLLSFGTLPTTRNNPHLSFTKNYDTRSADDATKEGKDLNNVDLPSISSLSNNITSLSSTTSRGVMKIFDIPQIKQGWWTPYVKSTSRIYPKLQQQQQQQQQEQTQIEELYPWCLLQPNVDDSNNNVSPPVDVPDGEEVNGLLYVKSHKASSSTCEAINNAIAHHVGQRKYQSQQKEEEENEKTTNDDSSSNISSFVCRHFDAHEFADRKQHSRRSKPNLLWTFVRHPQTRDVSEFFHFKVSRENVSPNNITTFQQSLFALRGRQSRYLLPTRTKRLYSNSVQTNPTRAASTITKIMKLYDFIGLTERMEDSLAVLTLLWNLHPTDVIVLKVKQSGGYDGQCTKIQRAYLTSETQSILLSSEYINGHADFLLYYAAELSLNRTIESLGQDVVHQRSEEIRRLQSLAQQRCHDQIIFVCDPMTGHKQHSIAKSNCYTHDAGCGYPCVDKVMKEYLLLQTQSTKEKSKQE